MCKVAVDVNLDRPDLNREALIYPIENIEGVNGVDHYHGNFFLFPFDIRELKDDRLYKHFFGRVFSDTQILIKIPSHPYSPLKDREAFDEHVPSNITDAMDHARHQFKNNKQTWRAKYLLYNFPQGHKLSSSEIYEKSGDDEKLEMILIPITEEHAKLNHSNRNHWVGFTVARIDIDSNKKGRVLEDEAESELAAMFDNLMST